ncbi:YraN family protein [Caniella muris]|uniref:YraN family protein n=1 Tax=Caniella muris TaxID=2941502 RepID=UPI00203BD3B0|nr:YraN family protein [Caniella muris]
MEDVRGVMEVTGASGAEEAVVVDQGMAADTSVPPWDAYPRPQKSVREYTERELGAEGEHLAQVYLVRRGLEIRDLNWVCPGGEADIVAAEERGCVVLVEVKCRLAIDAPEEPMPELAVDRRKRARYRRIALYYLSEHPEVDSVRFDVIAINIVQERMARLRHLVGAFAWDGQ